MEKDTEYAELFVKQEPIDIEYTCSGCHQEFEIENDYRTHLKSCGKIAPTNLIVEVKQEFHCFECGQGFQDESSFESHLKSHISKKIETTSTVKSELDEPQMNLFKCAQCNKSYDTKDGLKRHQLFHPLFKSQQNGKLIKTVKKHQNTACDLLRNKPNQYKKRLKDNHSEPSSRVVLCQINSSQKLNENPLYKCSLCIETFSSDSALQKHQELHIPEFKYECNYCGLRFTQQIYLMFHENSHFVFSPLVKGKNGPAGSNYLKTLKPEKFYQCYKCKTFIKSLAELMSHFYYTHPHKFDPQSNKKLKPWRVVSKTRPQKTNSA